MPVSVRWFAWFACLGGCSAPDGPCGPLSSHVRAVIDGDTIELESGARVRYLLVDAPEITNGHTECFGAEALAANRAFVDDRDVALTYDERCTDRYERLLAYVSIAGRELNSLLVERGYACVLYVPPDGDRRLAEFSELQAEAQRERRGLWGACESNPCE